MSLDGGRVHIGNQQINPLCRECKGKLFTISVYRM